MLGNAGLQHFLIAWRKIYQSEMVHAGEGNAREFGSGGRTATKEQHAFVIFSTGDVYSIRQSPATPEHGLADPRDELASLH